MMIRKKFLILTLKALRGIRKRVIIFVQGFTRLTECKVVFTATHLSEIEVRWFA